MPTKNPRVMVSMEPGLHRWLKKNASNQGVSISGMIRDIVRDAFRDSEDALWAKEGEGRLETLDRRKIVSHRDAWKENG